VSIRSAGTVRVVVASVAVLVAVFLWLPILLRVAGLNVNDAGLIINSLAAGGAFSAAAAAVAS
jgi:hypothetical protein